MSKIKELFGVEIREKFDIDSNGGGTIKNCFFDRTGALVVPNFDYLDVDTLILLTALISGEAKIIKAKNILDAGEKRYIKNVIFPFKGDVSTIQKVKILGAFHIKIIMKYSPALLFPALKNNNIYKGMKEDEFYSLKQLGI